MPGIPAHSPNASAAQPRANPSRIAVTYLIFGLGWIWGTDLALVGLGMAGQTSFLAAVLKGSAFVVVSTLLVYLLARRELRRVDRISELFRAITEGTTDLVFIKDRQGRVLFCNTAVARTFGKPRAELIGTEAYKLFGDESARSIFENEQPVLREGKAQTVTETLTSGGESRSYLTVKAPYRDEDGGIIGVIGIAHDVTERQRAEAAIRMERDRLNRMASAAPGVLFSYRIEAQGRGQFLFVGPALEEMTGLRPEELAEDALPKLLQLFHPDDAPHLYEKWLLAEKQETIWHCEFRLRHPTRGELWVEGRAAPGQLEADGSRIWHGIASEVTARKQAEAALEASQFKFRSVIDHVSDAVYILGIGGTIVDVNSWACESLGYAAEELIGQSIAILDPDFAQVVSRVGIPGRLERGENVVFDTHHQRKDGTLFPVEVRLKAFFHAGKQMAVSVVHDLTARVNAQAALRAERDRFDRLATIAPGVLNSYRIKPDGSADFPYASPSSMAFLGLSAEDMAEFARRPADFIHKDDLPRVGESVMKSARDLSPWICEYRFAHPQKGEIWIEGRSCPVRESDGSTVWHGILTDVTERVLAAEKVRASEQRFRELADAIPQIVWIATPEGGLEHLNARAVEYTGVKLEELTQWSWKQVIHPDDLPESLRRWDEVLRTGTPIEIGFRIRRHDGQYRWHVARQVGSRDASGAIVRWYGTCTDIHDLKQTEAALRAERDRFENLVVTVPGVIFSFHLRPDGTSYLPFASPAIEGIYGLRADELAEDAAPLIARIHPDDLPRASDSLRESAARLTPWRVEYRLRHPAIGERWVEGHALPIRDADGGITWQGYVADISERKANEATMQLQTEGLRLLSEAAATLLEASDATRMIEDLFPLISRHIGCDAFCYYTLRGDLLHLDTAAGVDKAGRECHQTLRLGELTCGTCAASRKPLYIEDVQSRSEALVAPLRQSGFQVYLCHPLLAQERVLGTLAFASRTKSRFTASEIEFVRTICHYIATTKERLRTEAALRESEERYRRLVDILPAGVLILIDGKLTFCNHAFVKLMAAESPEQLLGLTPYELIVPEYHEEVRRRLAEVAAGETPTEGIELRARRRDGTTIPFYAFSTPFMAAERWAVLVVILDLTQRERDQQERKALEEQVRQSQKMEALGRLAGGVAHDFNNLLTVINGHCDLVLPELPAGGPLSETISAIRTAGERAARLTEQLLSLSRKAIIEPKRLDLNTALGESTRLLRRLIGEDINLITVLAPGLSAIRVDPGQLGQVIMNLVVNARDAMPTGGTVTLQTRDVVLSPADLKGLPDLKPGRYVELSVRDTGCGMSEEIMAKIFEPFFTTKEVGKGTGLGLAVVHGIVKQADGHITVQSQLGQGTTFRILFPAIEERSVAPTGSLLSAGRGTETILLVEDEDAVRKIARLALTMHGYQIIEARSGREALRLAHEHPGPIDLLVTDVVMPEMGGRELVEALRAEWPKLNVLYMSGYTDDSVVRHGVLDAIDSILQKPFTPITLARKVRAVLDAALPQEARRDRLG